MAPGDLEGTLVVNRSLAHELASSLECGICTDYLNAPFVLGCGHSFCGECLLQWLPRSMTCPQCRETVVAPPHISLVIRDIIDHLLRKTPTLSRKVPIEQDPDLDRYLMSKLKNLRYQPCGPVIYDAQDQVQRCVHCHWEIEDGRCWRCNPSSSEQSEHSDYSYHSLDESIVLSDDAGSGDSPSGDYDEEEQQVRPRRTWAIDSDSSEQETDEEEPEEEDDDAMTQDSSPELW